MSAGKRAPGYLAVVGAAKKGIIDNRSISRSARRAAGYAAENNRPRFLRAMAAYRRAGRRVQRGGSR